MKLRHALLCLIPLSLLSGCGTAHEIESLAQAHYSNPVDRYAHYALGKPHEYSQLVATTAAGRRLQFRLPEDEVFEDLAPRLVRLSDAGPDELLTIVSKRNQGSRLVLIGIQGTQLAISAESPAIGMANRWLNPVGVADLDGDGIAEIAAVLTPHIGGSLKVYRKQGTRLVEIASLDGFSNHVYGTPALDLSAPVSIAGRNFLLVPDVSRFMLRFIGLKDKQLFEYGRCALPAPIVGLMTVDKPGSVTLSTVKGPHRLHPVNCLTREVD